MKNYTGNVFVVSRLGQIRNVQNFINQFGLQKNILVVQYSIKDSPILKNIIEMCDRSLYIEIVYLKLPRKAIKCY